MLAGLAAIDFALLVVAADDGVMPQTIEHLQILDLLAVPRGLVAITKCDRVAPERVAEVRDQITRLLHRTCLSGSPTVEVCALDGRGIDSITQVLVQAAARPCSHALDGRNFRLAIDRVFSKTGSGTIVTGTAQDGRLDSGASLVITPSGKTVRVRALQSGGRPVDRVQAGERCALNLAGAAVEDLTRGDWLLTPGMLAPTHRIEALMQLLAGDAVALRHNSTVHIHLGTTDRPARVLLAGQPSVEAGDRAIAQILLEQPVFVVNGDRFIIRDPAARRTLGAGRVIDPMPPPGRREQAKRPAIRQALETWEPEAALAQLLGIPDQEIDLAQFERTFNLEAVALQELCRRADAVVLGRNRPIAIPAARLSEVRDSILSTLAALHREQAEQPGVAPRVLRSRVAPSMSSETFLAIQRGLLEQRSIESVGHLLRLPGHVAGTRAADRVLWEKLQPLLRDQGLQPITAAQLAQQLRMSEPTVKALLYRLRAEGEVWRITDERFLPRERVAQLAATAELLVTRSGGKGFTAAEYRDAIGTGRTFAIQILEAFDATGVTRRSSDLRRMQPDFALVVGSAQPFLALEKPNNPAQPPKKVRPVPPSRIDHRHRR
jgi:selenocysteine-specific elongation factor